MILHEDKKKFHSAIQMAAAALKIKPHFVEKDYWICRSLQQMVRSDASHHAIFKGGTSLTKANPHNRKKNRLCGTFSAERRNLFAYVKKKLYLCTRFNRIV